MTPGETARKVLIDDSGRQSQSMIANDVQVSARNSWILPVFCSLKATDIPFSCLCYSYADSPPLPNDATSRISYRRRRPGYSRVGLW